MEITDTERLKNITLRYKKRLKKSQTELQTTNGNSAMIIVVKESINDEEIVINALEKQIPYVITNQDEDTGICKCGRITEIIDGEYFCKYCGQKVIK